ncbi:unnamed protein product [Peronospora destructor]|uniref:WW domain-containing protein n=1 Tax=Peronospora destructor TaxID=86335 RepID=A0AAV0VFS7_9STRA|nr:unnamed protein product [Peronospora destructor]
MDVHVFSTSAPSDANMTADQKLYWLSALHVVGDWSVHDDGDGRLFYYDRRTDSSQWEVPEGLVSLETEFMTKLMLQNAVARSSVWTAHDAGNGTLYYFNAKTRVSAWERPSEWGEAEAVASVEAREKKAADTEKEKEKEKKEREGAEEGDEEAEKEEEPLTAEEVLAEKEHNVRKQKWIEQFLAMLRDKNIMPFCKWSVALPQIAGDPRFMGVPMMNERRAIFDHFVEHRREGLKMEKKSKMKHAKQVFTQFLREQFQLDLWKPKTTLNVFLSTLDDNLEPERYKQVQDDALVFLTLSTQEKIYSKAVAEYKSEALKRDGEQLRLTKFLEDKLVMEDTLILQWEGDEAQKLIREFYSSELLSGMLLSEQKQRQVFEELIARKTCDLKRERVNARQLERSPLRRPTQDHSTDKQKKQSSTLIIFVALALPKAIVSEIF